MDRVLDILRKQNISIDHPEAVVDKLERYMNGILRLNEKINLTAITGRDEFIQKHFLDSLMCAGDIANSEFSRIINIRTGTVADRKSVV